MVFVFADAHYCPAINYHRKNMYPQDLSAEIHENFQKFLLRQRNESLAIIASLLLSTLRRRGRGMRS